MQLAKNLTPLPAVLSHTDNLKRAIALGAVLLSLSATAQQSGLYCYLGACGDEQAAASQEAGACCHHHACDQHSAPTRHGHERPTQQPCPCSDDCWCQQTPQPVEQTRAASDTVELALRDVLIVSDDVVLGGRQTLQVDTTWALPPDPGGQSAIHRCALYCRFLI